MRGTRQGWLAGCEGEELEGEGCPAAGTRIQPAGRSAPPFGSALRERLSGKIFLSDPLATRPCVMRFHELDLNPPALARPSLRRQGS